jgi:hypothetical protein
MRSPSDVMSLPDGVSSSCGEWCVLDACPEPAIEELQVVSASVMDSLSEKGLAEAEGRPLTTNER